MFHHMKKHTTCEAINPMTKTHYTTTDFNSYHPTYIQKKNRLVAVITGFHAAERFKEQLTCTVWNQLWNVRLWGLGGKQIMSSRSVLTYFLSLYYFCLK